MDYSSISTKKQLANFLRCDIKFLESILNTEYFLLDTRNHRATPERGDVIIQKLYLRKKAKKGGFREVYNVYNFQLGNTLKIINTYLTNSFKPDACVHGFVPGRSIKSNARIGARA